MMKDAPGGERVAPAPPARADAGVDSPQGSGRFETAELEALIDSALGHQTPPPGDKPKGEGPYAGLVVDHRYVIEALLAEGGMGLVYRCRHQILGKKLAMKIIRADMAQVPEAPQRFLLEAKAASAIGNEHIIDIIDFGALPDGAAYLVMELLEGLPLSALVDRQALLAPSRLVAITTQIAEALGAAHHAGIVHRDLKPDNVFLLDRKGEDFIKILDFGVAQMAEARGNKLTQAGAVVGTPHYMSPEQCAGRTVNHQSDIYALGVMMYELASGRVPFDGEHYLAVLNQHLQQPPPPFATLTPPPPVSAELERIIVKCLAKVPEQRYATMADLIGDLARLTAAQSVPLTEPGAVSPKPGSSTLLLPVPNEVARPVLPQGAAVKVKSLEVKSPETTSLETTETTTAETAPTKTAVLVASPGRAPRKSHAPVYVGMTLLLGAAIAAWGLRGLQGSARPAHVVLPSVEAPSPPQPASAPSPPQPASAPSPPQPASAPSSPARLESPLPSGSESPLPSGSESPLPPQAMPGSRVSPIPAPAPTERRPKATRKPAAPRAREKFINPWPAR
jgi:serine/threonine protein kinase